MNWAEVFSLDSRAFYLWGSFGAFAIAILAEIVLVRMRGKRINSLVEKELMASKAKGGSR